MTTDDQSSGDGAPTGTVNGASAARPYSPWAIAAALLCLSVCLLPLVPVLGWRALMDLRANPHRRGRGLAWGAIVLGSAALIALMIGGWWWNRTIRPLFLEGPAPALQLGLAGNVPGFLDAFDPELELDEENAARFLNAFTTRYGRILDVGQDIDAQTDVPFSNRSRENVLMYRFDCELEDPLVEATVVVYEPGRGWLLAWRQLVVRDPERGDLHFPADVP